MKGLSIAAAFSIPSGLVRSRHPGQQAPLPPISVFLIVQFSFSTNGVMSSHCCAGSLLPKITEGKLRCAILHQWQVTMTGTGLIALEGIAFMSFAHVHEFLERHLAALGAPGVLDTSRSFNFIGPQFTDPTA